MQHTVSVEYIATVYIKQSIISGAYELPDASASACLQVGALLASHLPLALRLASLFHSREHSVHRQDRANAGRRAGDQVPRLA